MRSTYFYIKKQLKQEGLLTPYDSNDIPKVELSGTPPEEVDVEDEIADAHGRHESDDSVERDGADWWKHPQASTTDREAASHRRGKPLDDLSERDRLNVMIDQATREGNDELVEKLKRQLKDL